MAATTGAFYYFFILMRKKNRLVNHLKAELSYLKAVLNSANEGIYVTDRDRRFLFWNRASEKITGYKAEEVIGKSCYDNILQHTDETGELLCLERCPLVKSMQLGRTYGPEVISLKRKDGKRIMVEVMTSPLKGQKGEITGGIEVFRDVTERIKRQRQLDRKKRELETVLENISDGVLFLDNDGRIIHINSALKSLLSIDDTILGKEIFSLRNENELRKAIFRSDREFKGPFCWENFGCQEGIDCPEYGSYCCRCWLLSKYGTADKKCKNCIDCISYKNAKEFLQKPKEYVIGERVVSVSSSFIEKREPEEIWEIVLLKDVTAEKLDAVVKLSGAAAHEIRQPLQVLIGAIALLRDELQEHNTDVEMYLETALSSCYRIDDILKRLTNITKYKVKYYTKDLKIFDVFEASKTREDRGSFEEEVK